ncbi:MAG: hypothetical protein JWO11_343 [Nocardioides sp.]|nr:hypothetical protein [Nocardioides sp.]
MTAWSAVGGESLLAHGIHYALVIGGVGGLGALLLPGLFDRARLRAPVRNDLERRIRVLRADVADGSLVTGIPTHARLSRSTVAVAVATSVHARATAAGSLAPVHDTATRLILPLAIVSSLAAAGVHAAVGPAHLAEGTRFGLFFAVCALLQLAWAALATTQPHRRLLVAGFAGNLAVIALWTGTRTVGLPGLLPGPEAVGAWDAASGAWELTTVAACAALLLGGRPERVEGWSGWHPVARCWLVGSVLLLGVLSLGGAPA